MRNQLIDILDHLDEAMREAMVNGDYGKVAKLSDAAQRIAELLGDIDE